MPRKAGSMTLTYLCMLGAGPDSTRHQGRTLLSQKPGVPWEIYTPFC